MHVWFILLSVVVIRLKAATVSINDDLSMSNFGSELHGGRKLLWPWDGEKKQKCSDLYTQEKINPMGGSELYECLCKKKDFILTDGCKNRVPADQGNTALALAVRNKNAEIFNYLLDKKQHEKSTKYMYDGTNKKYDAKYAINTKSSVTGKTALDYAFEDESYAMAARIMLEITKLDPQFGRQQCSAHLTMEKKYYENERAFLNGLLTWCRDGNAKIFIQKFVQSRKIDVDKQSLLLYAAENDPDNHLQLWDIILSTLRVTKGAQEKNQNGETCLIILAKRNDAFSAMKVLTHVDHDDLQASLKIKDKDGHTALFYSLQHIRPTRQGDTGSDDKQYALATELIGRFNAIANDDDSESLEYILNNWDIFMPLVTQLHAKYGSINRGAILKLLDRVVKKLEQNNKNLNDEVTKISGEIQQILK